MATDWGPVEWILFAAPFVLPALAVFYLARPRARRIGEEARPLLRALHWVGLVTAACAGYLVGLFLIASFVSKPYFSARVVSRKTLCQTRLRQLSTAVLLYAQDWSETLPPAGRWGELVSRHLPEGSGDSAFRCPAAESPYGFAFNVRLDSRPPSGVEDPAGTVLLLEADTSDRNAAADPDSRIAPERHSGGSNVAYLDGQVRWLRGAAR